MLIEYIGLKAKKADNVAGTGLEWLGAGDVHDVHDRAAITRLLTHPEIWRVKPASVNATLGVSEAQLAQDGAPAEAAMPDDEPAAAAVAQAATPQEPAYKWVLADDSAGTTIVLDTMAADDLQALIAMQGLAIDGRVKDLDKRRAAVYAAITGKEA